MSGGARRRRRRAPLALLLALAVLLAWVFSLGIAYRAGTSEQAAHIQRLERDLAGRGEFVAALSRQVAEAEQKLRAMEAAAGPPPAPPDRELAAVAALVAEKVQAGFPVERLAAIVAALSTEPHCPPRPEIRSVKVAVGAAAAPVPVRFSGGQVHVRGVGIPERRADGSPADWFDPGRPLAAEITIAGTSALVEGVLPLHRTTQVGGREYRVELRPGSRRGYVDVALAVCEFG